MGQNGQFCVISLGSCGKMFRVKNTFYYQRASLDIRVDVSFAPFGHPAAPLWGKRDNYALSQFVAAEKFSWLKTHFIIEGQV